MANPDHLATVKLGPRAILQWRKANRGVGMDLSGADLRDTPIGTSALPATWLDGADLTGANLSGMYLTSLAATSACLREANLQASVLMFASLEGADLTSANMQQCYLHGVDLRNAKLNRTDLMTAALADASVAGADFSDSLWGSTLTGRVDLSAALGLDKVEHRGSSFISTETLSWSRTMLPDVFLRGCGIPNALISELPRLLARQDYQSCMISYTEADDKFSQRLYDRLRAARVKCWLWRKSATFGEPLRREIADAIEKYDRVVVILSHDSLKSGPVLEEIGRALEKEDALLRQGHDQAVLFPILLDDSVFTWDDPLRHNLVRRVIGDFTGWRDEKQFEEMFGRLLAALRKSQTQQSSPARA